MSEPPFTHWEGKYISGCLGLGLGWGVSFWGDENILKLDYGDGYTTM